MARDWLQIQVLPVDDENTPWLSDPQWCRCLNTVLDRLDENQRRWVLGLLSLQLGRGGISRLAEITGMHNNTFTKARRELAQNLKDVPLTRVRHKGGGRKTLTETDLTLESDLEELIQSDIAGDPSSGDCWVRQTLRQLSQALNKRGHSVCPMTVRALLKKKGFRSRPTANASQAHPIQIATDNSTTSKRNAMNS